MFNNNDDVFILCTFNAYCAKSENDDEYTYIDAVCAFVINPAADNTPPNT